MKIKPKCPFLQHPLCNSCNCTKAGQQENDIEMCNDSSMSLPLITSNHSEADMENEAGNNYDEEETILQNPNFTQLDQWSNCGQINNKDGDVALLRPYCTDDLGSDDINTGDINTGDINTVDTSDNLQTNRLEKVCHLSGHCLPVANFQNDGTDIGKYLLFGKQFKVNPEEWPGKIRWTPKSDKI